MSNVRDVGMTMHRLSGAPSSASGTSPETGGLTGHEEPRLDGCGGGRARVRPSGSRAAPLGPAALSNRHAGRPARLRGVLARPRGAATDRGGHRRERARRADVTATFLACYAALLVGRSLWLGEPLAIPLHRLESGALVLFAFFMISDPKTTPDSRAGRVLFAALVALGAHAVQFWLFRTNGLLWSLAICSLAVPLLDRLLPGARYQWKSTETSPRERNLV